MRRKKKYECTAVEITKCWHVPVHTFIRKNSSISESSIKDEHKKMIGGYKEFWTFSVWMWLAYITVLYLTILFIFSNGDPFEIESKTVIWMSSYFIHDILVSFIDYLWEVRTNAFIIADCFWC